MDRWRPLTYEMSLLLQRIRNSTRQLLWSTKLVSRKPGFLTGKKTTKKLNINEIVCHETFFCF